MRHNLKQVAVIGIDGSGKSSCSKEILKFLPSTKRNFFIGDKILAKDKMNRTYEITNTIYIRLWQGVWMLTKRTQNKSIYKYLKVAELVFRTKASASVTDKLGADTLVLDGAPLVNIVAWGSIYYPEKFSEDICLNVLNILSGKKKMKFKDKIFFLKNIPLVFILKLFRIRFSIPSIIIFLKISPKLALERIVSRREKIQFHEQELYLNKLQQGYAKVIKIMEDNFGTQILKLKIDDLSFNEETDIINKYLKNIL